MNEDGSDLKEREMRVRDALKKALGISATVVSVEETNGEVGVHIVSPHAFNNVADQIPGIASSIAHQEDIVLHVTLASSWRPESQRP